MLNNNISNIIADGIIFQFFDLVEVTKDKKIFEILWKMGILLKKNFKVVINKNKIRDLFLEYRLFVVYEGKDRLAKYIDRYLESKGILINKVIGVSTRRELDGVLEDNVIKYYISKDGKDLFKRVIKGITLLEEIL